MQYYWDRTDTDNDINVVMTVYVVVTSRRHVIDPYTLIQNGTHTRS